MNCNKPKMSGKDVMIRQLNALQNNDINNHGISVAYFFASPLNKSSTGPYTQFKKMILSNYKSLLNFDDYTFLNRGHKDKKNRNYQQDIIIFKNNKEYLYRFNLSRQYDYKNKLPIWDYYSDICLHKYWRTDSVVLLKNNRIESFKGGDRHNSYNILNNPLKICSLNPRTGFYRDGYCNTGSEDLGTHTVCTKVTNDFLNFSKERGNDLITPSQNNNFPGLKDGDYWCLCANRYKEADEHGIKLDINKEATHINTLDYTNLS